MFILIAVVYTSFSSEFSDEFRISSISHNSSHNCNGYMHKISYILSYPELKTLQDTPVYTFHVLSHKISHSRPNHHTLHSFSVPPRELQSQVLEPLALILDRVSFYYFRTFIVRYKIMNPSQLSMYVYAIHRVAFSWRSDTLIYLKIFLVKENRTRVSVRIVTNLISWDLKAGAVPVVSIPHSFMRNNLAIFYH